ncbi:MAG: efflux RND transporter periplasmic adaptor subunit [Betaproteobacteria bacterium]
MKHVFSHRVAASALVCSAVACLSACSGKSETTAAQPATAEGGAATNPPGAASSAPAAAAQASTPAASAGAAAGNAANRGPGGGAPVSVTLVKAEKRSLAVGLDLTGTVTARRTVDVRAQVGATIREVLVREGDAVRQGQVLFRLDDRNERAQLERAQAQVLKDEAALADARRQLKRSEDLLAQNFVSQGAVDVQRTAVQTQDAAVAASRAALNAAQVALSFMTVTAPQEGRLGAITVHPGAYVSPGGAALVTISQLHPVLVSFSLPQRNLPDALAALKSRATVVEVRAAEDAPAGGKPQVQSAAVVFVDNVVDAASGTVRVRAELDNRDSRWWPGAYVKVRMNLNAVEGGAVVPVAAVVQGARGRTVFVVDDEGIAQAKPVELLAMADGFAALKGIAAGDRVVLEGRQNVRNGSKVIDRGRDSSKPGGSANTAAPGSGKEAAAR